MKIWRRHNECRACRTPLSGNPVFSLGHQPLANDFRSSASAVQERVPLEVLVCPTCTLAQLSVVVDPEVMFRNYSYRTSPSETMHRHFEALHTELGVSSATSVVEIGGNDGAMLEDWHRRGCGDMLIVDPAENIATPIPHMARFFDEDVAEAVVQFGRFPDLVIARHVFCHVDKWDGFIRAIELICAKHTVVAIEVPYAPDMLDKIAFDTIYHEHLSYLTIRAVRALLKFSSLRLHKVVRYNIHGGSVLLILHRALDLSVDPSVDTMIEAEAGLGESRWLDFAKRATAVQENVFEYLEACDERGDVVYGYGAPAKATVMVNACGLNARHLALVMDTTPGKQGKFIPGTTIPIMAPMDLTHDRPDKVFVFAWNFAPEILAKEGAYLESGGAMVVPVPTLKCHELQRP